MQFHYILQPEWPELAWLAYCTPRASTIRVLHGPRVESRPAFFCEAVWDGPFADGDLDATDVVAGTGARIREDTATFVSSASTLDRLHALALPESTLVSNSLPCLLAACDGAVDRVYGRYHEDFYSVVHGLDKYRRELQTTCGDVSLTYFDNLRWDGLRLSHLAKPERAPEIDGFDAYAGFMRASMAAIAANASDPSRRWPLRLLGTLSSGYDSSTVSTLAAAHGCDEVLSFDRTHRDQDDSGDPVASHLGLRCHRIDNFAWRQLEYPEIPFVAANSMGEEVRFRGAEHLLRGRVLLTGYHGDKIWDIHTKNLSPQIVRGDPSGSSLTEYRLWTGFIHCAVPFWGVRRIAAINAVSRMPEMAPWDVGGSYSRPICRRIVESAGVPREAFGVAKRNASVMLHNYDDLLTAASREAYFDWLREHRSDWWRRGRMPPVPSARVDRAAHRAAEAFGDTTRRLPIVWRLSGFVDGKPVYLRRHLFPWALEQAKKRYHGERVDDPASTRIPP